MYVGYTMEYKQTKAKNNNIFYNMYIQHFLRKKVGHMLGDTVHFLLAESGVEAPEGAVLRPGFFPVQESLVCALTHTRPLVRMLQVEKDGLLQAQGPT